MSVRRGRVSQEKELVDRRQWYAALSEKVFDPHSSAIIQSSTELRASKGLLKLSMD